MLRKSQHIPACPHGDCEERGRVHRHGFLKLKQGRRRRYLCKACGHTFVTSRGTPYYRIQSSRAAFDRVVALSVEGISIASIARLQGKSWSTVSRWLQRAAAAADRFSDRRLRDFELLELQLDEMRTFALGKDKPTWIYASLEVSSRLWTTTNTGRRGWRPTLAVMRDVAARAVPGAVPLIATDGYRYYKPAIRKTIGGFCVYGQVIKTRRKDRVVKVERKLVVGERADLANALARSEDSSTINISFIERLNVSVRATTPWPA